MKALCKIKKEQYQAQLSTIVKLVSSPKYLCMKCLRSASEKNVLCKPSKL